MQTNVKELINKLNALKKDALIKSLQDVQVTFEARVESSVTKQTKLRDSEPGLKPYPIQTVFDSDGQEIKLEVMDGVLSRVYTTRFGEGKKASGFHFKWDENSEYMKKKLSTEVMRIWLSRNTETALVTTPKALLTQ